MRSRPSVTLVEPEPEYPQHLRGCVSLRTAKTLCQFLDVRQEIIHTLAKRNDN